MKSGFGVREIDSDQKKGAPLPPFEKPVPEGARLVDLPKPKKEVVTKAHIYDCVNDRKSRRRFTSESLTLDELAYLLWATQGVREVVPGARAYRTVPSAGCRHPFDTYLAVTRVQGLEPGIYRYLAMSHQLALIEAAPDIESRVAAASGSMTWIASAPVVFVWAVTPYRSEWRYAGEAQRLMLLDAGHVCQNLYLAAESIGCGTCAIGAFPQAEIDAMFGLDGKDEFVVYCAPVGKV
ncbi:MAG TPA: SagB/ThcOx family dehydrogenase [Firmicutes bacterium]|nr:SagB/ThcOx family dehydrogenase [Candidatus Fermentithermobacillaceae bacterium]